MYDFNYKIWFYLQNVCWDGREKPETKKFPVWLSSHPPSTIWRPTVFGCPRTLKTSRTYPKWSNGKKEKSGSGAVKTSKMNLFGPSEEMGWSKSGGIKIGMGKILEAKNMVKGVMTYNILLTRYSRENKVYLLGMGPRRTRTADAMRRKRREGWLQHCPLSYDQAHCIHPPFVECYAIQGFSFASDLDPKLMSKEQYQITIRKVCIVIQSLLSCRPNHHSGLGWDREKHHTLLTLKQRQNVVYDVTNVEQHELLVFDASRLLPDVIPERTNSHAVVEGVLSRFF